MERLTIPDVRLDGNTIKRSIIDAQKVKECAMELYWRLKDIEDAIADEESEEHDLSRLRELVQADREGRCVVLPISVPSMAYTVNPKEKYISTGIYMTPGSVLHDTERGYIIAKTYEVAEATLKEREKNEP